MRTASDIQAADEVQRTLELISELRPNEPLFAACSTQGLTASILPDLLEIRKHLGVCHITAALVDTKWRNRNANICVIGPSAFAEIQKAHTSPVDSAATWLSQDPTRFIIGIDRVSNGHWVAVRASGTGELRILDSQHRDKKSVPIWFKNRARSWKAFFKGIDKTSQPVMEDFGQQTKEIESGIAAIHAVRKWVSPASLTWEDVKDSERLRISLARDWVTFRSVSLGPSRASQQPLTTLQDVTEDLDVDQDYKNLQLPEADRQDSPTWIGIDSFAGPVNPSGEMNIAMTLSEVDRAWERLDGQKEKYYFCMKYFDYEFDTETVPSCGILF